MNAVEYIESLGSFPRRPSLERISALLERLGDPQKGLPCFHVAGTNGKGSVCRYIWGILHEAGYRAGLYLSPYVDDFRERISVSGEMIPPAALEELTERVTSAAASLPDGLRPTQFDFITAVAFSYFKEAGCDAVVLETGLGGLYDPTNVVEDPLCAVITSVSKDHTAVLGNTLAEIAAQKAGIMKPGRPVVVYPEQDPEVSAVLRGTAREKGCPYFTPDLSRLAVTDLGLGGSAARYGDLSFTLSMPGGFQPLNAATAIETVARSGHAVPPDAVVRGLERAKLPARCEVVEREPPLVFDGAHNPGAARRLAEFVRRTLPAPVTAVMGMMADKDVAGVLRELAPCFARIYCVEPPSPRAMPAGDLAALAREYTEAEVCPDPLTALRKARSAGASVVVCGSLYLFRELRSGL